MRQDLPRVIPARARFALRRGYEVVSEQWERVRGRKDPLVPPAGLMFVGGGRRDFRPLGEKWVATFIRVANLERHEQVLDVGCGVGRMAVGLTGYLSPSARYEGFDIVSKGIEWCRREISTRFPNFGFQHADLYNHEYNPSGRLQASEYRFPYPDESFDFAFMTSVFTHMLPADIRNYLGEVHRVLKPGGRCLITWFVLNPEARELIASGRAGARNFEHDLGGYWVVDPGQPEAAVAYTEPTVHQFYREANLAIQDPILYGAWCGRPKPLTGHSQDIVLATKRGLSKAA